MRKRGLSAVIATVLLILLAILAVIIIWTVLRGFLKKSTSELNTQCLTLDLEIEKAEIDSANNTVFVRVKRNTGEGNLVRIRFKFYNSSESFIKDKDTNMRELERITFDFNDAGNVSSISKVEIAGIVSVDNNEKVCRITSSKNVFGVYVPGAEQGCGNECVSGNEERLCESSIRIKNRTCGNYDSDSCYEWSGWSYEDCESGNECKDGVCKLIPIETRYADPNGDNAIDVNWANSGGGEAFYTYIDEVDGDQGNLDTNDYIRNDYFDFVTDSDADFDMETLDIGTDEISSIKIWIYGETSNYVSTCTLHANINIGGWQTQQLIMDTGSPAGWYSTTFTGTWTQADLNALLVRLRANKDAQIEGIYVYAMYGEITYT